MPNVKITKTVVDSAKAETADWFIWDNELKGFGLKVSKGGRKTYVCQYRTAGGRTGDSRRLTIGAHGSPWTVETARAEARKILGRAANGEDPAQQKQDLKKRLSVAELCGQYLQHGCATKKASTLATDRGRIERHIKPLIGRKKVQDVTRADIKKFLQDIAQGKTAADIKTGKRGRAIVRGGEGTATRTVGLLGGIFAYAVDCGMIGTSPVHGVKRFADRKSNRYLSQQELAALGEALRQADAENENPSALAILKLLVFTGARKGEIESLAWPEVDFEAGYLKLADSKTGQKAIPLNAGALQVLQDQKRIKGNDHVFPAYRGGGHYEGTPKVWERIRSMAGIQDVRLHDLRHSFASIAVSGGASLPIIGALLGHAHSATTQRYAHLSDDPLRAASEAVGNQIAAALAIAQGENVIELRRARSSRQRPS
ncbi:MAG: tyrosine-type recombinase/integrase [Methylococcales bacterium]